MILLIDNYDSFSYNLYQLIGSIEPDIKVIRNDEMTVDKIAEMSPECIILSPGPGKPSDAGICEDVIRKLGGIIPIMGVCLGHQAICEVYGAIVTYASRLVHGKQSVCSVDKDEPLFKGLEDADTKGEKDREVQSKDHSAVKLEVARYHSLAAKKDSIPECLKVIALSDDDGEVMAVRHKEYPVYGLQFHPESILTPRGNVIIRNFLRITRQAGN